MNRLEDASCATPRWRHLPWTNRSPRPHKKLMIVVCDDCPAFDACASMVDEMIERGEVGVGFLAGRSQTERAVEVSDGAEQDAQVLSRSPISTSKRG